MIDYSFFSGFSASTPMDDALERHFLELEDLGPTWRPWFKREELANTPHRSISRQAFFGDWYDADERSLIMKGMGRADGVEFENPTYRELGERKIENWGFPNPDIGSGGQYAYAFSHPPYGLRGNRMHLQDLFHAINEAIMPRGEDVEITDWSSPELARLSNYFEAGMEWWGVFLFTLFIPRLGQLAVISASTTD